LVIRPLPKDISSGFPCAKIITVEFFPYTETPDVRVVVASM